MLGHIKDALATPLTTAGAPLQAWRRLAAPPPPRSRAVHVRPCAQQQAQPPADQQQQQQQAPINKQVVSKHMDERLYAYLVQVRLA